MNAKLNHWYFEKVKEVYRIWGNVTDHARFSDGQWIRTSTIKEIVVRHDHLLVKTAHSCYEAAFAAHQNKDARILKKALHDYIWPEDEDVYAKIMAVSGTKDNALNVKDCSTCTVLVFTDTLKEVHLKYRNKIRTITSYDIHSGMFNDVTEVSDPKLDYCYRFFSFQKNCYEFEEWNVKYAPVFLRNDGTEMIYASTIYGDFAIAPGMCNALDPENLKDRVSLKDVNTSNNKTTVLSHESLTLKKD